MNWGVCDFAGRGKQNGKVDRAKQRLVLGKSSWGRTGSGAWRVVPPWGEGVGLLNSRFRQSLVSWSWWWKEPVRWWPSVPEKSVWGAPATEWDRAATGGPAGAKHRCIRVWISSVQFSSSVVSDSATHGLQHARSPCPSPTPGVYPISCPLSRWCHPTISSSVVPFSCLQSFPASGSFPMSQLFPSGGHQLGCGWAWPNCSRYRLCGWTFLPAASESTCFYRISPN